jgi:hypothetical protein
VCLLALGAGCADGNGDDDGEQAAGTTGAATSTTNAPEQDAGDFMKQEMRQVFLGQYGRSWDTLHPAHQTVVSRDKYDTCMRQSDASSLGDVDIDVIETYDEPIGVDGVGTVDSKAVTVRFRYDNPLTGKKVVENATVHAVPVNGEWKWVLPPEDYRAYKKGSCPPED